MKKFLHIFLLRFHQNYCSGLPAYFICFFLNGRLFQFDICSKFKKDKESFFFQMSKDQAYTQKKRSKKKYYINVLQY